MYDDLLPRIIRGQALTAERLNRPIDRLNQITQGVRPPRQVTTSARPPLQIRRLEISVVGADVLTCLTFNANADERQIIYVARPPLLRSTNTSHNGIAFTGYDVNSRTADTEAQSLVPPYLAGDVIFAMGPIPTGSGIVNFPQVGDVVVWQDMNVDARVWATDP